MLEVSPSLNLMYATYQASALATVLFLQPHNFTLKIFGGVTLSNAEGFFLALCSGINLGSAQLTICGGGIDLVSTTCKVKCTLSLAAISFFNFKFMSRGYTKE